MKDSLLEQPTMKKNFIMKYLDVNIWQLRVQAEFNVKTTHSKITSDLTIPDYEPEKRFIWVINFSVTKL